MQMTEGMICEFCGKENPRKHQDFCKDLGCSGRMIIPKQGDAMKMFEIAAEAVKEVDEANIETRKGEIITLYKQMKAAEKVYKTLQHKYDALLQEDV